MSFPIIIIDSGSGTDNTGSGATCSGAGPGDGTTSGTKLTGTAGVTATDGTTAGQQVNLDGSPDLSNVAVDGSHAIYFADTTSGNRRFARIVAKGNSGTGSAYVQTGKPLGGTPLSGTGSNGVTMAWGIGGKLASLGSATSKLLVNNVSAIGDARGGWALEFQSGHTDSFSALFDIYSSGDATADGPLSIRGKSGAGTKPILTWSSNTTALNIRGAYLEIRDFEMQNTAGSKTSAKAIDGNSATTASVSFIGLKIADATHNWLNGFANIFAGWNILGCEIGNCTGTGIKNANSATGGTVIRANTIYNNGSGGILDTVSGSHMTIEENLIVGNTGVGIQCTFSAAISLAGPLTKYIRNNTIDGNSSHGIEFTASAANLKAAQECRILNNLITNNGGSPVSFSGSGVTAAILSALRVLIDRNGTFGTTSGYVPSGISTNDLTSDPGYVDRANGTFANRNYAIGTALKANGSPQSTFPGNLTHSYVDPGAAQRQEAGGSGGFLCGSRLFNGM